MKTSIVGILLSIDPSAVVGIIVATGINSVYLQLIIIIIPHVFHKIDETLFT
jgi:hexokinase